MNVLNVLSRIKKGDIIILHDVKGNFPFVAEMLKRLHERGFKMRSLSKMFDYCKPDYVLPSSKINDVHDIIDED